MDEIFSSHVLQSIKSKHNAFCQDSRFSEAPHISEAKASEALHDTPKENLSQYHPAKFSSRTPRKNRPKDFFRSAESKESTFLTSYCETPKVHKKDAGLRRRLLMSKAATDGKTANTKTPESRPLMSARPGTEGDLSTEIFDSPDSGLFEALATSTLKAEEMTLSCRKRRLIFSQVKSSTLEDGSHNVTQPPRFEGQGTEFLAGEADLSESIIYSLPSLLTPKTPCDSKLLMSTDETFHTPVNLATNLVDSLSVLSTPSFTPVSKLDMSVSEDSGFTSLNKSQDSSVDHDGSFQELLPQSASKAKETPKLAELRRRTKLERQRRLPTLREGGSQSEEEIRVTELVAGKVKPTPKGQEAYATEEDHELFLEKTPIGATTVKLEDLSLTPALQVVHAICQKTAKYLQPQFSLEELRMSPEGGQSCVMTNPLTGLIGRKMGLEKLDILRELKIRNLQHILKRIFNLLSSKDIYSFGQVSSVWDEIISQDKMACRRRRYHLRELKMALKLGSAAHVPDAETRLSLLSRSPLKFVQAQSKQASVRTPVSGSSSATQVRPTHSDSKRDKFLQVAKTLFHDECLKPCPRCQHPAKCHSFRGEGLCSQEDCAYRFCAWCMCAYHGSRECASGSAKRHGKKEVVPGSAESKRNLRRL
ncbi:F-box only protein 43 [Brienomyrus brachyistius]|uniref:F-box only protein 43 n=1 Tax=Brienomyrus brachyistius TaxID=42636 RepID=UPI0020B2D0FB|nr:F-box only protein 43 [Brienomyrus brachyistius]